MWSKGEFVFGWLKCIMRSWNKNELVHGHCPINAGRRSSLVIQSGDWCLIRWINQSRLRATSMLDYDTNHDHTHCLHKTLDVDRQLIIRTMCLFCANLVSKKYNNSKWLLHPVERGCNWLTAHCSGQTKTECTKADKSMTKNLVYTVIYLDADHAVTPVWVATTQLRILARLHILQKSNKVSHYS